MVSRVESDKQPILALAGDLLHELRSPNAKAVVRNSEGVSLAQIAGKPLMDLFSNGIRQRRFRFVVNAQNLLSHGMRPPGKKAAFRWRCPAFHTKDSGHIDALAAEMSDQRVPCGVITHRRNRQDARAERRNVVGSVGARARNNCSFAMFQDEHRSFTRNARDFSILEFVGHEIAEENNRFRGELLDTLAEDEKVDRC